MSLQLTLPQLTSPQVAVIVVNWNGKSDTLACLESLQREGYANKEIIVVDNGSVDDSVAVIRARYPQIIVLETGANLGFTGGSNVGIQRALDDGAAYVYLLNNDTVVEPDALSELVKVAENNSAYGILTPVIYYFEPSKNLWFAGSKINLRRGTAVHDNSVPPDPAGAVVSIPWASGCAMLLPAPVLQQVKGFDDRFYLNWEDVDLSVRVRNAGFEIGLVPSARIYHRVGGSLSKVSGVGLYYSVRNNLLFIRLHSGRNHRQATASIIAHRLRDLLRAIRRRQPQTFYALKIVVRAIKDHLLGRYGPREL